MLKTKRLLLRPWSAEDYAPFAEMNQDPRVMEFYPSLLSREESDRMIERVQTKIEETGWGLWAVSVPGVAEFIGYIGLAEPSFTPLSVPLVEIGWRLAYPFWGKGYATEGALACLQYGFETLKLKEIISFTAVQNKRSRAVMERIGMHHNPEDDFDHPRIAENNPLRRHVLYRINASSIE